MNITFLLLDYILNFSFSKANPPKQDLLSNSPVIKQSKDTVVKNIYETKNLETIKEDNKNDVDMINSKSTIAKKDIGFSSRSIPMEDKPVDDKQETASDKESLKTIYINVIIMFFGNYYLSYQYDILVICLF
jgi:hypothetical protein